MTILEAKKAGTEDLNHDNQSNHFMNIEFWNMEKVIFNFEWKLLFADPRIPRLNSIK